MSRHDITDWVIHFVHKRNEQDDPLEFSYDWEEMRYIPFPDNFKIDGEPIFLTNKYEEDDYGLEPDADALSVLKKILHDGIIKTGWSFRKDKPTIYGPKSAACFTEMPLYALIEYSKSRNDNNYIEPFGIAFLKSELFEAGARPVIYGLSGLHKEAIDEEDGYFGLGFRTLSSTCGLGLNEMYRYVYTNIGKYRRIDWTHEREWRWADINEKFDFAGLPFYAQNDEFNFSKIIVIVKTNEDAENILEYLQHLYHSKSTNYGREYSLTSIANTYVLSIEELAKLNLDSATIKLEDLPLNSIQKLHKITVRKETLEKVKNAIKNASEIAYAECERFFNEKGNIGGCGWAHVITYVVNSEITQALIDLGFAKSYGTGFYYIYLENTFHSQSLDVRESGEIKAAEYLTKELGQSFTTHWEWD